MIKVENLHKRFGAVQAAAGVTFTAPDGFVTGLLGPNGAGKTTSLRIIYGLLKPESGTVLIDGQDVNTDPLAVRQRLGVLPDQSGLYPRLTAAEHMRYFGQLHGLNGQDLEQRIHKWTVALDLKAISDRRVAGFSHGERTKVAMARALIHDPQNVVLDEPTNGLDVMSTRAVRQVIRRLKAEGRCVLFSSHVMQEVSALCDRIVVMGEGAVVAEGSADDLIAQTGTSNLEDAFVALVGKHGDGQWEDSGPGEIT